VSSDSSERFVHLHVHSDYSLLHSTIRVKALAARVRELGMSAVALTDHGNLFGAIEFYLACRAAGLRPILGMEAFLCKDHRERDPRRASPSCSLVLLAESRSGFANLVKLSSLGYLEGLLDQPRIDLELLDAHREGLIVLSGGARSELNRALADENLALAKTVARRVCEIVGPDRYFIEIQNHGAAKESRGRELAAQLGSEMGLPLVATNNCHYLRPKDAPAQDVLLAIAHQVEVDIPNRFRYETNQYDLKSGREMAKRFQDYPDAIENTGLIAARCEFELSLGEHLLPAFPLPEGFASPEGYLETLARQGVARRYASVDATVLERLDYELAVIEQTGFAGYFLIVADFVKAARDRGIAVGPGRGSAAGSLVCYAIGITDIDPLKHGLLFERFLNPERISMPDIDIDFCFERRDEIIDYVVQKYGKRSVCQIITYGTMAARGVLRDTGRALGLGFGEVDRIAKLVPEQLGITLDAALASVSELREARELDPRVDRLLDTAMQLEGLHRHSSIHAAGILIAPGDLIDHVPLHKTHKEEVTTQWDMKMCEAVGLLKMDFLGLRTLTVIEKALDLIRQSTGEALRPEDLRLDDPAIFQLLGQGATVGIFQLESSGMQEVLRKLQPSSFEDITAVNALYRPGPLGSGMVDDFIECKHGRKRIEYLHPTLEVILEPTYGVILYQEQVMRIASDMAGFSMGQADTLRKAMGKKDHAVMEEMKQHFIEGAGGNGVPGVIAEKIFDRMAYFAGYGFNKSHSASYAVLSAQTAWLKAHHLACFMAATLSSEMGVTARVVTLLDELRRCGVAILPPDVNASSWEFRVEAGAVRYGLGAIKNVGHGAVEAIVAARETLGRGFASLYELCDVLDLGAVNRRVFESLNLAGALDSVPGSREQKMKALDLALARAQRRARDRQRGQSSLFGGGLTAQGAEGVLPDAPRWSARVRLSRERELTGVYLSGHPLDEYRPILRWLQPNLSSQVDALGLDAPVVLCGIISSVKNVTLRRNGSLLSFLGFEDLEGSRELLCFHEAYEKHRDALQSDDVLVLCGYTSRREDDEQSRVVVEKVLRLDEACLALIRGVHIHLHEYPDLNAAERMLDAVGHHPGPCPLRIHLSGDEFTAELHASRAAIAPRPALLLDLAAAVGADCVQLEMGPLSGLVPARELTPWQKKARSSASG
jgi:DNA polymerase-3 subunit alpha